MNDLKVFHNDVDWIIAESLEDVPKVLKEHIGYEPDDYELEGYEELDMDKEFSMFFVDHGRDDKPPESDYPKSADVYYDEGWYAKSTYRQWAEHLGRAFLASTEW